MYIKRAPKRFPIYRQKNFFKDSYKSNILIKLEAEYGQ